MTDAFITTAQIKVFNQNIFSIITDLKRNMRADIKDIHSEIIKTFDFKDTTKEYLQDKNQYAHNKQENKLKKNRNLDSYSVTDDTKEIHYTLLHIHTSTFEYLKSPAILMQIRILIQLMRKAKF